MRVNKFFLIALLLWVGVSCKDDDEISFDERLVQDIAAIDSFLATNSIEAVKDESGIRYVVHVEGSGTVSPGNENCMKVDYVGRLFSDNSEFDKGNDFTFSYASSVIVGWKLAFPNLQLGDSATLYIPSGLAYRNTSPSTKIPANSILVFGVELKSIGDYEFNPASGLFACYFD
jgi:FKBP-type peptidyl-prolyl cis-trans isomerase FkpA